MTDTVRIVSVEEHEDGSATYTMDLEGDLLSYVSSIGLKVILYCAVVGMKCEDVFDLILKANKHD